MAEQADLVAHLHLGHISLERDKPDRRRGGFSQLPLRLLADIRARAQLNLLGRQLHRKRETGRKAALLAVRLRKEFIDLYTA